MCEFFCFSRCLLGLRDLLFTAVVGTVLVSHPRLFPGTDAFLEACCDGTLIFGEDGFEAPFTVLVTEL